MIALKNIVNLNVLKECEYKIKNIGWTLGNACPYKCKHCYSMSSRKIGRDLTKNIIDTVIFQLGKMELETINLGGNEPIFTNGLNIKNSLLPYIIEELYKKKFKIGLTTSGITLIALKNYFPHIIPLLNDIDISLDSPIEEEHNENRGSNIFKDAISALEIANYFKIPSTIVLCAMNWNFTKNRIKKLVELGKKYNSNIRINTLKPTEKRHLDLLASQRQLLEGFQLLMELCVNLDVTDPILSGAIERKNSKRCPCGRTSFRIHSITPDGKIPISPCVYLHDFKVGDLLEDDIIDMINSQEFKIFRKRNKNPDKIEGCSNCSLLDICGGGCAAKAYLYNYHTTGEKNLFTKEVECLNDVDYKDLKFNKNNFKESKELVHMDYLCTWIGVPK